MSKTTIAESSIFQELEVGTWVSYPVPANRTYTLVPEKSGTEAVQTFSTNGIEKLYCRLVEIRDKFLFLLAPAIFEVELKGVEGAFFGADELHKLCANLFGRENNKVNACSIEVDNLMRIPDDFKKDEKVYWLASACIGYEAMKGVYEAQFVNCNSLHVVRNGYCFAVRPCIYIPLNSYKVELLSDAYHNGATMETAYEVICK